MALLPRFLSFVPMCAVPLEEFNRRADAVGYCEMPTQTIPKNGVRPSVSYRKRHAESRANT